MIEIKSKRVREINRETTGRKREIKEDRTDNMKTERERQKVCNMERKRVKE